MWISGKKVIITGCYGDTSFGTKYIVSAAEGILLWRLLFGKTVCNNYSNSNDNKCLGIQLLNLQSLHIIFNYILKVLKAQANPLLKKTKNKKQNKQKKLNHVLVN